MTTVYRDKSQSFYVVVQALGEKWPNSNIYSIVHTNIEYNDHATFNRTLKDNNLGFYCRPKEEFFINEAIDMLLDETNPKEAVLVENLS